MAAKKAASQIAASEPKAEVHPRVAFIRSIKLVGIGLDHTSSSIDRRALEALEGDELQLDVTVRPTVLEHTAEYFVLGCQLKLTQSPPDSETVVLSIDATFSAKFNLATPASEEAVKGFSVLEARLIFFPYLRHFVSDMSYRMATDVIVLPMSSELEN